MPNTAPRIALVAIAGLFFLSACVEADGAGDGPIVINLGDAADAGSGGGSDSYTSPGNDTSQSQGSDSGGTTKYDTGTGTHDTGMSGDDSEDCAGSYVACSGECVDLTTSDRHCGRCGNACPGGSSCRQGACKCSGGESLCSNTCVDTDTSDNHCGRCGKSCGSGMSCQSGTCKCSGNKTSCGGKCVDTDSNNSHCGKCGNSCGSGSLCQSGSCKASTKVQADISETNKARSTQTDCGQYGVKSAVPALSGHKKLHQAAQKHADDMAMNSFFSPTGSDGTKVSDRVRNAGFSYRAVGENIARGTRTAKQSVQGWIKSDGHCRNLMSSRFTYIGVGVAKANYGFYWVQVFASK